MSIVELMQLKNADNTDQRMALALAVHCAPVLKGSKAANILTVPAGMFLCVDDMLRETDISFRFIKTRGRQSILFLYREEALEAYLKEAQVCAFLMNFGYTSFALSDLLDHLSERIALFRDGETAFPHEIGVFLEYPLEDVQGFLENRGENFKYSGYWKVYHDVQGAKRRFRQFDMERDHVVSAVLAGRKICDIAASYSLGKCT